MQLGCYRKTYLPVRLLLVPQSTYERFDWEADLPTQELRDYARRQVEDNLAIAIGH